MMPPVTTNDRLTTQRVLKIKATITLVSKLRSVMVLSESSSSSGIVSTVVLNVLNRKFAGDYRVALSAVKLAALCI